LRNDERLRTIYEVMAPYIVRNEHNWRDYLAFASQFHKHSFDNILLVYAQDEDVSILATRKQWATIGRNLIPRAKGVAVCVYRNAKLTLDYLFDVSQTTGKEIHPTDWQLSDEMKKALTERLSYAHGFPKQDFPQALYAMASESVAENYNHFLQELKQETKGHLFTEIPAGGFEAQYIQLLTDSISYFIGKKCHLPDEEIQLSDGMATVSHFNMPTLPLSQTSLTKIAIRLLKKLSRRPENGHWHLPIRKTRMRCVLSWMTRKCRKPSMPYKEVPVSILIYKQRHRHPNYKKTPKGNYAHIGYIATRPGAVKNEGMRHGLFGKLEPGVVKEFDTWQEAARLVRELSYRRVNMYRGIISFSPETAAELGLSDHKAWEDYIDRHILTLAKFNGIRVQDLQWVAAHHNEKGHPHIHVVFWNKHQRTMVPFVHPSIPDKIRKQLIRDTFAERIKEYCEAKQRAKEHLSAITDEMIDEFEKYMEHLHPQEYRRLREAFGRITDDELGTSPLDSVVGAMKIAPFISRLFALKEKMPKKGRLYYKLLPEDVKAELDAFVAFLKENNEYIRNLVQDYAESKTRLAMLYDTDPAHIKEQQEKAVAEADKLIANKILDVIRTMLCKDREVQSFEYTEARKAYFTEQMICEILMALEQTAMEPD